jgi:hypothetical protein
MDNSRKMEQKLLLAVFAQEGVGKGHGLEERNFTFLSFHFFTV